jgi:hypothetical protein
MARLFEDGFDHYGLTETNMLDGVYLQADGTLSTSQFATGTHSLYMNAVNSVFGTGGTQRVVLPAAKDKMGITARYYFPDAPTLAGRSVIAAFFTSAPPRCQVSAVVDPNGRIEFYRGGTGANHATSGTLIGTTGPIINMSAWNHVEIQVYIHNTLGWVRVAVNGVHRYEATGLDTQHDTSQIVSVGQMLTYESGLAASTCDFYMDDYIVYDFTGTAATDTDFCPTVDGSGVATNYIGELQVMWLPPNGNTAEDDWLKSTGASAYELIDEVDPNDADYIYSTAAGDLTELSMTDLPEEITYIRGLTIWARMSKSDAGAAMIRLGMKSVAATSDAPERPVTVEPTYWWDQINVDPNSTTRWTRASLNAAWIRLTRNA